MSKEFKIKIIDTIIKYIVELKNEGLTIDEIIEKLEESKNE